MKDFLRGAGSVISLFPSNKRKISLLQQHSDIDAITNDWKKVGQDMERSKEKIIKNAE